LEELEAEGMINANIFFDIGFFLNHEVNPGKVKQKAGNKYERMLYKKRRMNNF
jgi:hypothetical protein